MRWIDEIDIQSGIKVLLRADFNVPVQDGEIIDTFRIDKTLPTLRYLNEKGAHVTIITHFSNTDATAHGCEPLKKYIASHFSEDEVCMYDKNVRDDAREKENDETYAQELAEGFDLFVQDAFAVCHREHASVVSIPKFLPSAGGLLLKSEVAALEKVRAPESHSLAIVGGAKFKTKEPLIHELLDTYDNVHVTGALANDFWHTRGLEVGLSKVSDATIQSEILNNEKIVLPDTVTTQNIAGEIANKQPIEVTADEKIVDALAPNDALENYETVLWNGPAGYYEGGFTAGTHDIAQRLVASGAHVVAGGGDTLAAIKELGLYDKFAHVSTGGGAMLEFILKGTLPGISALK